MFAALKQRLGIVSVSTTPTYIIVQGIDTFKLMKDIYAVWGSTVIQKNMFSIIRGSELRMRHFFGLDFLYICQTLYEAPQTRLPRRVLGKVIEEMKLNTWLGQVDRGVASITDVSVVDKQIPFPPKPFQTEFIKHYGIMVPAYRLKGYLLDAGPGTGKAQPLWAKIKVPGGWVDMGDIQVGDKVIARDGTPTTVTGVFPQGKKDIFRVSFADDRFAECCADHLWEIYNGDKRDHLAKSVVNTTELMALLEKHPGRIYVPLAESEQSPTVELPVDPYLLGVLIGDGCLKEKSVYLSTPDQEILDSVAALLPESIEVVHAQKYDYRLQRKVEFRDTKENVLMTSLRRLDLMGCRSYEKFIPEAYLSASHEQRLHLLQGLMDTDGYVDMGGNCSYSTSSEQLAFDVQYLVRSLGGIASIRAKKPTYTHNGEKRQGRLSYTVRIRHKRPSELFRLTKKKERTNDDNQYAKGLRLRVERIERVSHAQAQCISVDHHEHLYVTNDFVVTHNTVTNLCLGAALGAKKVIVLTPKNAINRVWEDTVKDIMNEKKSYWVSTSGQMPTMDHHYYLCHYEALEQLLAFIKLNEPRLSDIFVALDESHNFNRQEALRTQWFIELCQLKCVSWVNWASGTPILAMGVECIPFLRCVDPLFDKESEERFRKIYGRDAKRANDILRNRIGHLKFHVPKQDVVHVKVNTQQHMVKIPNGHEFTLSAIGERMRKFIEERRKYYADNFGKYRADYNRGIEDHKLTLSGPAERVAFAKYQECFKTVSSGFDPKLMKEEAAYCNQYELRTIIPKLHPTEKPLFKSARSVLKYVDLKIMGEALGGILGRERTRCHVEMLPHIDFSRFIDNAKKKTLVFTSFVEVVERSSKILRDVGYDPAMVYGATNKDLAGIVSKFYKLPDLNPLVATYQSLSTAVPLTVANQLLLLNQPFRSGIREQTVARAARLGQDQEVDVWDILLDTGDLPNISTRSNDIMEWSQQQVASIIGVQNVDLDSLALESLNADLDNHEVLQDLVFDAADVSLEALQGASIPFTTASQAERIPGYLYHGSMYKQDELMPGFKRSGKLVKWDGCEDNTWLYTTPDKREAQMLGLSSAVEKQFDNLKRWSQSETTNTIEIEFYNNPITVDQLYRLPVYLYTIGGDKADGWMANYNQQNGMAEEYKTQATIRDNIARCEEVDIRELLQGWKIRIR